MTCTCLFGRLQWCHGWLQRSGSLVAISTEFFLILTWQSQMIYQLLVAKSRSWVLGGPRVNCFSMILDVSWCIIEMLAQHVVPLDQYQQTVGNSDGLWTVTRKWRLRHTCEAVLFLPAGQCSNVAMSCRPMLPCMTWTGQPAPNRDVQHGVMGSILGGCSKQ